MEKADLTKLLYESVLIKLDFKKNQKLLKTTSLLLILFVQLILTNLQNDNHEVMKLPLQNHYI